MPSHQSCGLKHTHSSREAPPRPASTPAYSPGTKRGRSPAPHDQNAFEPASINVFDILVFGWVFFFLFVAVFIFFFTLIFTKLVAKFCRLDCCMSRPMTEVFAPGLHPALPMVRDAAASARSSTHCASLPCSSPALPIPDFDPDRFSQLYDASRSAWRLNTGEAST